MALDESFASLRNDQDSVLAYAFEQTENGKKTSEMLGDGNSFDAFCDRFLSWRWQINRQVRSENDLQKYRPVSTDESSGFAKTKEIFHVGVTPYYQFLSDKLDLGSDCPVRLQAMPSGKELSDAFGQLDPLEEEAHSPVPEVVHAYPDRVAFCVASLCPVYCRYCFRKRRDQYSGIHFNKRIVDRGIEYIRSNKAIRDVLITGGDPFLASDAALVDLVARIRNISHVEVIRFGTRTPVTLPYRVTKQLASALSAYHPIWINTHFNCIEELTADAKVAIDNLVNAGFPVGNQAVLLRGVNDSYEKMINLCRKLVAFRIRPYYVFHPHMIAGTEHLRVDLQVGVDLMEKLRGNLSGFAIPVYALDTPTGKIPLTRNRILGRDKNDLLVEGLRGEIWREPNVYISPT